LTAYGSPQSSISTQQLSGPDAGMAGSTGYLPPQTSSPTTSTAATPQDQLGGQPPSEANRSGDIMSLCYNHTKSTIVLSLPGGFVKGTSASKLARKLSIDLFT